MIDVGKNEEDDTPPTFAPVISDSASRKRRSLPYCSIHQIKHRDYTEPAFEISSAASDDRSNVKFFLDVGTFAGGNDVARNNQLGGSSTVSTTTINEFPSGVPLYFTMHAENSANVRSQVMCMLTTYDTTPPTGRVSAEFKTTSNPALLKATITIHDDSDVTGVFVAIGYGIGSYGDQLVSWNYMNATSRNEPHSSGDPLEQFSSLQEGKLVSPPISIHKHIITSQRCANLCIKLAHCVSFNYDYGPNGICELLRSIRHYNEELSIFGLFYHFERLSSGHAIEVYHDTFSLLHNHLHYVNMELFNELGYHSELHSEGILTDFTCPDPGYISNIHSDILEVVPCESMIPEDRPDLLRYCIGMHSDIPNHRTIHDDEGSETVFNGDEPMKDMRYTRNNNYVSGNWDGIHDNETGIRAYTMSVGRDICEDWIHPHHDPHKHLMHESQWTNMAIITPTRYYNPFPLPYGKYYISIRAINKVEHGGPLSTTICHTTPYIIDNTRPDIYELYDIKYDEDMFELSFAHNTSDIESDLMKSEFCLGSNLQSCDLLPWTYYPENDFVEHLHEIPNGVPTWIRLRVTNNVELYTIGRADQAIIIDTTAPFEGNVYDGPLFKEDLQYTKYDDKICANWFGFYDPESGIASYEIGVGSEPGLTDIAELKSLHRHEHTHCVQLPENKTLIHDNMYYVVIWAYNAGLNQRNVSGISDGVRVDLTKPEVGTVKDGSNAEFIDLVYSSSKTRVQAQWKDYYDPQSGIRDYSVQVWRKRDNTDWHVVKDWTRFDGNATSCEWRNFQLQHRDEVKSILRTSNGALNEVDSITNGFIVDLTTPALEYLNDGATTGVDIAYQLETDQIAANFFTYDPESGVKAMRYQLFEKYQGVSKQIYPLMNGGWQEMISANETEFIHMGLNLKNGRHYFTKIAITNGAGLVATFATDGFIIDSTEPTVNWIRVGVLSGLEEVVDGFVWQSDHYGIKVSWSAVDFESSVTAIEYAVGTEPGNDDILEWTFEEGNTQGSYIPCTLVDTDLDVFTSVYYVAIRVINGVGLKSSIVTSTPIVVVPEDVTGTVIDSQYEGLENDIDYQADSHTITMHFAGFESSHHGIMNYDWAIGTVPGGEDVQTYLEHGVIHSENDTTHGEGLTSSGFAQTNAELKHGETYYTTLRAQTYGGNILQASSDGFVVDLTPPDVTLTGLSNASSPNILNVTSYQYEQSVLRASWDYSDDNLLREDTFDNINSTWFSVGSYPHASDIWETTYQDVTIDNIGGLPSNVKPSPHGTPNIVIVGVKNVAGLQGHLISHPVVLDNTAPLAGTIYCPKFIQSHSVVTCTWDGFKDPESIITKYTVSFGTKPGYNDLLVSENIPGHLTEYSAKDVEKEHKDIIYATVTAENAVGLTVNAYSDGIFVDNTPPESGIVVELSSSSRIDPSDSNKTVEMNRRACTTENECRQIDASCTEALAHLGVAWSLFKDAESDIIEYQLALGTTPGGGQVLPFISLPAHVNHHIVTGLNLKGQRQIFATVKAVNFAGLSTTSTSNGVYMSYISQGLQPLSHIGVYDSHPHSFGDIDFQSDKTVLEAQWDVSGDPCPVQYYQWSVEQTDGTVIQDYIDMFTSTHGISDQLTLKEGIRYYSLVRIRNMLGYVYTLRSDGVTILSNPLLPGHVYDGDITGHDLTVIPSRTTVSVNWNGFGKQRDVLDIDSVLTGNDGIVPDEDVDDDPQGVAYYEVALGTDRRFDETRDNVVPFTYVGKNTSVTFKHLDLEPGHAVYYFTVRAHSSSYAIATATSNGFYVTFNGFVSAGTLNMPDFAISDTALNLQWDGFTSNIGIMMYYVAVSTSYLRNDTYCGKYVDGGTISENELLETFDVFFPTNVGPSTFAALEDLNLEQNSTYYTYVIGVDKAGECNMTMHKFTVDITPPETGRITAGPDFDMAVAYTAHNTSVFVKWEGFLDEESGVDYYNLTLYNGGGCETFDTDSTSNAAIESVKILSNYTSYEFTNITLLVSVVFYVKIEVKNHGGLVTTGNTSPVLYDKSIPTAGKVSEVNTFIDDVVWWGNTEHVNGSFLHYPIGLDDPCPSRNISMFDEEWSTLDKDMIDDPDGIKWALKHRAANIFEDRYSGEIGIKIARDSKTDQIFTAAYTRSADFITDGTYQVSIKAADGDSLAVTGVTFWDGDDNDIHLHTHRVKDWGDDCSCCLEQNVTSCACNCTDYLSSQGNNTESMDDPIVNVTTPDRNVHEQIIVPQQSCGIQIYTGDPPYIVTWCKFFNNTGETMSVTTELDFNPSQEYHIYKLKFTNTKEDLVVTACFDVFLDNTQISQLCGIPLLSSSTKIVLHAWNKDNIVPPLDIFDLWQARAYFKQLVMPPASSALCRYGEPFRGDKIAIYKYEAGIGTAPRLTDVTDYQEIYTPCIPCTDVCSKFTCFPGCQSEDYTLVPFNIRECNINATYGAAMYITVRATLGSGASVISSSNGFYIDITPPDFITDVFMYIDVHQGEFTPSDVQGSNDTIKAIWLCEDDVSEIQEYQWAIGTTVAGTDIQGFESTQETSMGINHRLAGILEHNTTYYVSIKCTNEAGLVTTWHDNKGVVVLLEAPDTDTVAADAVGAEHFDADVYPQTAVKSSDPSHCGESWTVSTDPNIKRYDFCVGSSKTVIDDIVPCIWVGYNTSGIVEIKNGSLYVDGFHFYAISDLRELDGTMHDSTQADNDDNVFQMEPGRTLFLYMRLCNKAQVCSVKFVNSLLITSNKSTLLTSEHNGTTNGFVEIGGRKMKRDLSQISVETPQGMVDGQSILINELTDSDWNVTYKSGATSSFTPYIVDPAVTINQTERLLYRRIHEVRKVLTISPVGQEPLPGPLKLTFIQHETNDDDFMDTIIHWNPEMQQWELTDHTCVNQSSTFDNEAFENDTSTILVCNTRSKTNEPTIDFFSQETQFMLAKVATKIYNSAPVLTEPFIVDIDEDSDNANIELMAFDPEDDPIRFEISEEVSFTFGNVTLSKDGILSLSLCNHCFGSSNISIQLKDAPLWDDVVPMEVEYQIQLNVNPVNDPPSLQLVSPDGHSLLHADPTETVLIFLEQGKDVSSTTLAVAITYDVDGQDKLEMITYFENDTNSIHLTDVQSAVLVNLLNCSGDQQINCKYSTDLRHKIQPQGFNVTYKASDETFYGLETMKVVVKDEHGIHSDVITVTIAVMQNKCIHGSCKSLNPAQYTCKDTRRAIDFDTYYTCECPPSWTGPYCGQDVDECSLGLCEAWKQCDNIPGGFNCYCKQHDIICQLSIQKWEFGLMVTAICLVVIIIIVVFGCRIYKKNKYGKRPFKFDGLRGQSSKPSAVSSGLQLRQLLNRDTSVMPELNFGDESEEEETDTPTFIETITKFRKNAVHPAKSQIENQNHKQDSGNVDTVQNNERAIQDMFVVHNQRNEQANQSQDSDKSNEESDEETFVHPRPAFSTSKLREELGHLRQKLQEDTDGEDLMDHPPPQIPSLDIDTVVEEPPELHIPHLVTRFRKNAVEPIVEELEDIPNDSIPPRG